jgi:hypothetical protein
MSSTKKTVEEAAGFDPIRSAHEMGIRSHHAYLAGFASIVLSMLMWLLSRAKKDERAQSDRWGIFIGHWAPTFLAIGIALKQEED